MTYKDYLNNIAENFVHVLNDNLLFWNLWNACYPFEILKNFYAYRAFFEIFDQMWNLCWKFNDAKKLDFAEFNTIFTQYYPFIISEDGEIINPKGLLQQEYNNLDEDNLAENCITQLIYSFNIIYEGIENRNRYGLKSGNIPLEIISLILKNNNLGLLPNNMDHPLVANEVGAQIKLIKELSSVGNYTYINRNIYREETDQIT